MVRDCKIDVLVMFDDDYQVDDYNKIVVVVDILQIDEIKEIRTNLGNKMVIISKVVNYFYKEQIYWVILYNSNFFVSKLLVPRIIMLWVIIILLKQENNSVLIKRN